MSDDFPYGWLEHHKFDVTTEAYWIRLLRLGNILEEFGHFEYLEISMALHDSHDHPSEAARQLASQEKVAKWLRSEFHQIRKEQRMAGKAPILTGRRMSLLDITDVAISMLQSINQIPGPELIALLAELLNQDSHRRDLANQPSKGKRKAALLEARNPGLTVNKLARLAGVDKSSVSRWRREHLKGERSYEKLVQSAREILAGKEEPPSPPKSIRY